MNVTVQELVRETLGIIVRLPLCEEIPNQYTEPCKSCSLMLSGNCFLAVANSYYGNILNEQKNSSAS
jgi:hypothetical protein